MALDFAGSGRCGRGCGGGHGARLETGFDGGGDHTRVADRHADDHRGAPVKTLLLILLWSSAWAQFGWTQVEQPALGVMLDSKGAARPVFGVAASVTLGNGLAGGVVSMGC